LCLVKNVQKKFKKTIDTAKWLWDSGHTHGNTYYIKNMRTKALLCAAGFLAAAAATSMAQSNVYSLNVVGYINVPWTNGFQMVANQLHSDSTGTNNTVGGVFSTNLPNLSRVYGFDPVSGYGTATFSSGTGNWVGGQPTVNRALSAGGGVWLQIPGTTGNSGNVTEVGEVHQGTTALAVVNGFQIMSLVPPDRKSVV